MKPPKARIMNPKREAKNMTVGMLLATILLVLTFSGVLSGAGERLLMGYRPATTAERERANADDEYNEMLKKKYFIHINIAPYGEIPEETKENDRILTRFLYRAEQ